MRLIPVVLTAIAAIALSACAVVGTAASVTGSVVSTTVEVTGDVVGAAARTATGSDDQNESR